MFKKILLAAAILSSALFCGAQTGKPVCIIRMPSAIAFSQNLGQYVSGIDPRAGSQIPMLIGALLMSPQMAALATEKPIAVFVFENPDGRAGEEPVVCITGFAREGINAQSIALPGTSRKLLPMKLSGGRLLFAPDKTAAENAKSAFPLLEKMPKGGITVTFPECETAVRDLKKNFQEMLAQGAAPTDKNAMNAVKSAMYSFDFLEKICRQVNTFSVVLDLPSTNMLTFSTETAPRPGTDLAALFASKIPRSKDTFAILPSAGFYAGISFPGNRNLTEMTKTFLRDYTAELGIPDETSTILQDLSGNSMQTNCAVSITFDTPDAKRVSVLTDALLQPEQEKDIRTLLSGSADALGNNLFRMKNRSSSPSGGEPFESYVKLSGRHVLTLLLNGKNSLEKAKKTFAGTIPLRFPETPGEFAFGMLRLDNGKYVRILSGNFESGRMIGRIFIPTETAKFFKTKYNQLNPPSPGSTAPVQTEISDEELEFEAE